MAYWLNNVREQQVYDLDDNRYLYAQRKVALSIDTAYPELSEFTFNDKIEFIRTMNPSLYDIIKIVIPNDDNIVPYYYLCNMVNSLHNKITNLVVGEVNMSIIDNLSTRIRQLEVGLSNSIILDIDTMLANSIKFRNLVNISNQRITIKEELTLDGIPLLGTWTPDWTRNNIDYFRMQNVPTSYNSLVKDNDGISPTYGKSMSTSIRDDGWIATSCQKLNSFNMFIGLPSDAIYIKQVKSLTGFIAFKFHNFSKAIPGLTNARSGYAVTDSGFITHTGIFEGSNTTNRDIPLTESHDKVIACPSTIKANKNTFRIINTPNTQFQPFKADRLGVIRDLHGTDITPTLEKSIQLNGDWVGFEDLVTFSRIYDPALQKSILSTLTRNWVSYWSTITGKRNSEMCYWKEELSRITLKAYVFRRVDFQAWNGTNFSDINANLFGATDGYYDVYNSYVDYSYATFPNGTSDFPVVVSTVMPATIMGTTDDILSTDVIDLSLTNTVNKFGVLNFITVVSPIYLPEVQSLGFEIAIKNKETSTSTDYLQLASAAGISIHGIINIEYDVLIPPVGYVSTMSFFITTWYEQLKITNGNIDDVYNKLASMQESINNIYETLAAMSNRSNLAMTIITTLMAVGEIVLTVLFPPAAPFIMAGAALLNAGLSIVMMASTGTSGVLDYLMVIGTMLYQIANVTGIIQVMRTKLGLTTPSAISNAISNGIIKTSSGFLTDFKTKVNGYYNKINKLLLPKAPLYNIAKNPYILRQNVVETTLTAFKIPGIKSISNYFLNNHPNLMTKLNRISKAPAHSMTITHVNDGNKMKKIFTGVEEGFNIEETSLFFKPGKRVNLGSFEFTYTETNTKGTFLLDSPDSNLYTNNSMKNSVLKHIYSNMDSQASLTAGGVTYKRGDIDQMRRGNYTYLPNETWDNMWDLLEKSFTYRYQKSAVVSSGVHNLDVNTAQMINRYALINFSTAPYNLFNRNCQTLSNAIVDTTLLGRMHPIYSLDNDEGSSTYNLLKYSEDYIGTLDEVRLTTPTTKLPYADIEIQHDDQSVIMLISQTKGDLKLAILNELNDSNSKMSTDLNVAYADSPDMFKPYIPAGTVNVRDYVMLNPDEFIAKLISPTSYEFDSTMYDSAPTIAPKSSTTGLIMI